MNYIQEEKSVINDIEIRNYLPEIGIEKVKTEIIKGLSSSPKFISSKYFYDKKGSELFEEITKLEEYYPTRSEKEILSHLIEGLAIDFRNIDIIELGSGDASKISILFKQIAPDILSTINYFPVDISESALEKSTQEIAEQFNLNSITGIVADFYHQLHFLPRRGNRLFCFFGSTIGNFTYSEIEVFMRLLKESMHAGDSLLLGVDMIKDTSVLERAYNDNKGITAAFNKNILNVVNTLIRSDFNVNSFEHMAFYNSEKDRIEMHLKATEDVQLSIDGISKPINIKKGEAIHTENSHKFNLDLLEKIGGFGDLRIEKVFTDTKQWFSLFHFTNTRLHT